MIHRVQLVRALLLAIGLIGTYSLEAQEANQKVNGQPTQAVPQTTPIAPSIATEQPSPEPQPEVPAVSAPEVPEGQLPAPTQEQPVSTPPEIPTEQPVEVSAQLLSEPAVAPEVVAEEPQPEESPVEPQPPLGPDEIMGIDTVDLESPQGNWLYKRVWWEKAEKQYEKIRNAVNKILEMRTGFFAKRAELDKTVLDPFYIKIGLSQGELQEILSDLISRLTKEAKTRKDEVAEDAIEQAESDKQELQQLQKEVEQVVKQDAEVEDAIIMLVEQINKIRGLEQEAWQNFKSIARVLDDKKARELFYKVDNAWRNIQELHAYIDQTYSSSFDQLIERIKERIKKIDSTILSLKEKGVDLKQRVLSQIQQEEEEQEEEPKKGIFTRYLIDPIKNVFSTIWSVIRWPIDKIMGRTAAPADDEQEEEAPAEEAAESTPAETTMPEDSQASQAPQPVLEDIIEEEVFASVEKPAEPSMEEPETTLEAPSEEMVEESTAIEEPESAPDTEPVTDELEATIEEE